MQKYFKKYLPHHTYSLYQMIERSIFSDRPRSPVRPVVALIVLMVILLLTAGCMGGDIILEQDLAVIKLNHDGSMAWMKTIDSGKDDEATDVVQTSNGGYVIAGGYSTPRCNSRSHLSTTPKIIQLSNNGDIIWEREYPSELTAKSRDDNSIKGLVQMPDNGFYIILQDGKVVKISSLGILQTIRLHDTNVLNKTDVESFIRTHDGGSAIAGFTFHCELNREGIEQCPYSSNDFRAFVEKLDRYGNISWSQAYDDSGFSIISNIVELKDDKGYVSVMKNNSNNSLVILDNTGDIINSSLFRSADYHYNIQSGINGFSVFTDKIINNTYEEYSYNNEGMNIGTKYINNYRMGLVPTNYNIHAGSSDMDYLSLNKVQTDIGGQPTMTTIHVLKSNSDGTLVWDRQVTSYAMERDRINLRGLIETSDGGYLMVLGIEKTQSC